MMYLKLDAMSWGESIYEPLPTMSNQQWSSRLFFFNIAK